MKTRQLPLQLLELVDLEEFQPRTQKAVRPGGNSTRDKDIHAFRIHDFPEVLALRVEAGLSAAKEAVPMLRETTWLLAAYWSATPWLA